MNSLDNPTVSLRYDTIRIVFPSGLEIRFPYGSNPRLAKGTPKELTHVEVSPFGIHWPELDEDLSFEGLSRGDYGQGPSVADEVAEP